MKTSDVIGQSCQLTPALDGAEVVWHGECPRCRAAEHTLRVRDSNGTFHCVQCGWAGDVFTWVMYTRLVNFSEALTILSAYG